MLVNKCETYVRQTVSRDIMTKKGLPQGTCTKQKKIWLLEKKRRFRPGETEEASVVEIGFSAVVDGYETKAIVITIPEQVQQVQKGTCFEKFRF